VIAVFELDNLVTRYHRTQNGDRHMIDHFRHVASDELRTAILFVAIGLAIVEAEQCRALLV